VALELLVPMLTSKSTLSAMSSEARPARNPGRAGWHTTMSGSRMVPCHARRIKGVSRSHKGPGHRGRSGRAP
jgi:hypothetical protein